MVGIVKTLLFAFATPSKNNELTAVMSDNQNKGFQNHDVLSRLRSLGLGKKELPHHTDLRRASILVPLFERTIAKEQYSSCQSNIHVLFTQRPKAMKSHGGEVCFPGGKQDPEDELDDIRTALREAHEEVGLRSSYIESIARLETVESKHSLCVTPIVGIIQPPSVAEPSQLKLNTTEVEAAFAVPLEYFADEENCVEITKVKWSGGDFLIRTYLWDDVESGCQFKIWGLTAHVIHHVATMAFCKL